MKVTVLMVVFNGEKHLEECIKSIISQTFPDFELLIIDDGSTDNSLRIIHNFTDGRIRLIRNSHSYIDSLNLGLKEAQGEYIARMDVDDIMDRCRLEEQVAILENHLEVAACMCWAKTFGLVEKRLCRGNGFIKEALPELLNNNFFIHSSAMLRKSFLLSKKLQYKNYPYAEDYKLWVDMSMADAYFWIIPKVLLKYRTSYEQVSAKHAKEQEATTIRIKNELLLALLNDEKNEYVESLRNIYSIMENMNVNGVLSSNSIRFIMSILFKETRQKHEETSNINSVR